MRLHLRLSPNRGLVPYTYQQNLVGTFHRWLGINQLHDRLSLYSFSWLKGGQGSREGLHFGNGACWFISSPDITVIKQLMLRIQASPEIAFGMSVIDITIQETPAFSSTERFALASPVLIKRTVDGKQIHYVFDAQEADQLLTETLRSKLKQAGLAEADIQVKFDLSYTKAKTKTVTYKGIRNKANMCPLILEGSPEAIGFAWNVGIGNSTGIGFGALL